MALTAYGTGANRSVAASTVGVEEEFFVVDAATRELRPRAERVRDAARARLGEQVQLEINLAQIEIGTPVCGSLAELDVQLHRLRGEAARAAAEADAALAATGTHPFSDWRGQQITPKARYSELDETYQLLAWEQLVCGCHVHVGVDDAELAVAIMDRTRPYLPTLRALAANSPYYEGVDTGYASYRVTIFDRWPTAGMPPLLQTRAAYDQLIGDLVACAMIPDSSKVYWDVRPSARYATLEFRIADTCATVQESVLIAALCRALVRTCEAEVARGEALDAPPMELLRAARWRAARYGLDGDLVDVAARRARPGGELLDDLLGYLRPDLESHGEWERVAATVAEIRHAGTGAQRQRRAFARRGVLPDVVDATTLTPR